MANHSWTLGKTAVIAALIGLSALGTMIIRIPIPATEGYFNIGDVFVILAGLWLGPLAGFLVGAIGPTIADAIGFPQFMLATFVTKGLEGFLVGLIGGGMKEYSITRRTFAASIGGLTIVIGYFVFEALIYPWLGNYIPFFKVTDYAAAILEAPVNLAQAIIAVFGGIALWKPLGSSLKSKT